MYRHFFLDLQSIPTILASQIFIYMTILSSLFSNRLKFVFLQFSFHLFVGHQVIYLHFAVFGHGVLSIVYIQTQQRQHRRTFFPRVCLDFPTCGSRRSICLSFVQCVAAFILCIHTRIVDIEIVHPFFFWFCFWSQIYIQFFFLESSAAPAQRHAFFFDLQVNAKIHMRRLSWVS